MRRLPPPPFGPVTLSRALVLLLLSVLGCALGPAVAHATPNPSGVYIVVDPYNTAQLAQLYNASQATTCAGAEPFCTASSGVFLKVDWCRYQGYPDSSAPADSVDSSGHKNFSCHYYLGLKKGATAAVETLPSGEVTHQCPGTPSSPSYDTDSTCSASPLKSALSYTLGINALRVLPASGSLPALHVELSLSAGVAIPEALLKSEYNGGTGSLQPLDISFVVNKSGSACLLEPQVWQSDYVNAYTAAYDRLIHDVGTTLGSGTNPSALTLVKVSPLNELTAEYDLPGPVTGPSIGAPPSGPDVDDDVKLDCSSTPSGSALKWINAYYPSGGTPTETEIDAMEQTFGTVVGNIYGELKKDREIYAGISIGTNNSAAYPAINCGMLGGGYPATNGCAVQASGDQWSTYYFLYHVNDLFATSGSSVAQLAAQTASLAQGYTFALTKANFYVNTTNLSDPTVDCSMFPHTDHCPVVSVASLSCNANNSGTTNNGSFTLNGNPTLVQGIGTQIGIQTMVNLANTFGGGTDYCTAPSGSVNLGDILNYGIANGTHFIEITPDLAADSSCYPYMANATTSLLSPPYSNCLY